MRLISFITAIHIASLNGLSLEELGKDSVPEERISLVEDQMMGDNERSSSFGDQVLNSARFKRTGKRCILR